MGALDHPAEETPLECAQRELFEETGYKTEVIVPYDPPEGYFIEDETNGRRMPAHLKKESDETSYYIFIALITQDKDPILEPTEHTDWRWCTFTTAYNLILWASEKKGIRLINDYLERNPLQGV